VTLRVIVRPEAETDLDEANAWYEEQLPGLGRNFTDEIDRTIEAIRSYPESFALVHRNVRRALTRRFPYAVFYVLEAERIVVLAVFHQARDPKRWRARVAALGESEP